MITDKGNQRFGAWITANVLTQKQIDAFGINGDLLRGVRLRYGKVDYNKKDKEYDFSLRNNAIALCKKNGLSMIFQDWNNPKEQLPAYWFLPPYNVPVFTTDDNNVNKYAYYKDPNYLLLRTEAENASSLDLKSLPNEDQRVIIAQLYNFGTTGDYDGHQGEIIPPADALKYDISDADWVIYVHGSVEANIALSKLNTPWLNPALNPSNASRDLNYGLGLGVKFFKRGELGHGHSQNGEKTYFGIQLGLLETDPTLVFFSESEGMQNDSTYTKQDFLPVVASFLHAGGKILSVAGVDKVIGESLAFLNTYAGSEEGGFSYMRYVVDYANKEEFTEETYGPVIDPARLRAYSAAVSRVKTDETLGEFAKLEKLSALLENYINPDRRTKIQAEYLPKGFLFDENSIHERDGGIDLHTGNYEVRLKMKVFEGRPINRLGDSSQAYGRFAADIQYAAWDYDKTGITEIKVTYYDTNATWSLRAAHGTGTTAGATLVANITGKGTKQWVTQTFPITGFKKGGINGNDIVINSVRKLCKLQMIEVK